MNTTTPTTKACYLCSDINGENGLPAVDYSPYGYPACASHYASDLHEFTSDYS